MNLSGDKNRKNPGRHKIFELKRLELVGIALATCVAGATTTASALPSSNAPQLSTTVAVSQPFDFFTLSLCNEIQFGILEETEQKIFVEQQTAEAKAKKMAEAKLEVESLISQRHRNMLSSRGDFSIGNAPMNDFYNPKIPMPQKYQSFLYDEVQKNGLDLKSTLAVILHESGFDPNKISMTHDYGYFQINIVNHADLAQTLGTPNTPLDPYVNIEWGTYMLSQLYSEFESQGLKGQDLTDAVLSSYNEGVNGFKSSGKAIAYIQGTDQAKTVVDGWFGDK